MGVTVTNKIHGQKRKGWEATRVGNTRKKKLRERKQKGEDREKGVG